MTKPEGVAAPLEPSPLEFVDEFTKNCEGLTEVDKVLMAEIAKGWAAAVSKNLQQELSLMEKKFANLMADSNAIIKQRESRILELEKEIAALRETKL